jgi:exodeoxyribonuclease-5
MSAKQELEKEAAELAVSLSSYEQAISKANRKELKAGQKAAIDGMASFMLDPERKTFIMYGYAGSGKTTIAERIADFSKPLYISFTNRACGVLRSKGCVPAITMSSLLYKNSEVYDNPAEGEIWEAYCEFHQDEPPRHDVEEARNVSEFLKMESDELINEFGKGLVLKKPSGTTLSIEKTDEEVKAFLYKLHYGSEPPMGHNPPHGFDVIVVDESSMIGKKTKPQFQKLVDMNFKIIAIGDPFQVEPVDDEPLFPSRESAAHALLTEVVRQGELSGILELATYIRENIGVIRKINSDAKDVRFKSFDNVDWTEADQIIVWKNSTRQEINKEYRAAMGYPRVHPVEGEKLLCIRNNPEQNYFNGELWWIHAINEMTERDAILLLRNYAPGDDSLHQSLRKEVIERQSLHYLYKDDVKSFSSFVYGYAMTVHKAQGSGWPHVIVVDESKMYQNMLEKFGKPDADVSAARWRYTAVTRAEKELIIVK